MKARSPFVASHALSRKTPVAPGHFEVGAPPIRCAARAVARDAGCRRCFSSLARLPEVTAEAEAGCPSVGGQRTVASFRRPATTEHLSSGAFFGTDLQAQFKRQSTSLRFQRWYASPCKFKARLRLHERGLTLPSSGPAYGGPLKSNVRPRKKPHHEITVVVRFTARAAARNSGCRRRVTTEAVRQGRLVPSSSSVEGSPSLRGVRPVVFARKQASRARSLAHLPYGHKAKTQVGLAQSRPSSSDPMHSWASAVEVWLLLAVSIYRFRSNVARSACASSVGMLRHPNANTNTKHGCGSPSVA